MRYIFKYKKSLIVLAGLVLLVLVLRFSPLQERMIFPGAWSYKASGTDENLAFFIASDG